MQLYTVIEASKELNSTRQSIYNKLKCQDVKKYVKDVKGVIYIEKEGVELIGVKLGCKINLHDVNNFTDDVKSFVEDSSKDVKEDIRILQDEFTQSLKSEIEHLRAELNKKNEQLEKKDNLLENMQILFKKLFCCLKAKIQKTSGRK
jgi:gas vesicle protein